MPDAVVGSVAVEIVPSAASFPAKLAAKVEPAAKALGERIGKAIEDKIAESIRDGLGKGFVGTSAIARREGGKSGSDFGGAFGREARTRIEAAIKSLPDAKIGVATSEAEQKLFDLRAELEALRDKRINVDIDEAEFFSEVARIQTALTVLGSESPHIQVKVDTARAALELGAFGAATKALLGGGGTGGGISKITQAASDAGAAIGGMVSELASGVVVAGVLATALIPLTAALVGVSAALLAPLAAAGGGLTIFGILAGRAVGNTNKIAKQIDELKKKASTLVDPKARAAAAAQAKALEDTLTGPQKAFLKAKGTLSKAFSGLLGGKTGDALFRPIVSGMNLLGKILPALSPVILAVSDAISDMLDSISKKAGGSGFRSFIDSFAKLAGSSLRSIGSIIGGITKALGGLFKAGSGTGTSALDSMADAAQRLGTYLNSDAGQKKLRDFFTWLRENGPGIAKDFGKIVSGIFDFLKGLEPFGEKVLKIIGFISDHWKLFTSVFALLLGGPIGALILFAVHFGTVKKVAKDLGSAVAAVFSGIQHAIGAAVQFMLRAFANILSGFANVLGALSHVPGFGWAKKAAIAMDAAAGKARQLADDINKVPNKIDIIAKAQTAAAERAIDRLNAKTRAAGAGVHYSNGYGGGQKAYAKGTNYSAEGIALVGEQGPELVYLPEGSQVIPADRTASMVRSVTAAASAGTPGTGSADTGPRVFIESNTYPRANQSETEIARQSASALMFALAGA